MKPLCLIALTILLCTATNAQPPLNIKKTADIRMVQPMTNAELTKAVNDLMEENKKLQQQVNALQTQVNANYKVLDYAIGNLAKKTAKMNSFVVTANASNMADDFKPVTNYSPGGYHTTVILDDESINGNPNAVVVAVPQRSNFGYNLPVPTAVWYDKKIAKWKVYINPHGVNTMIQGKATPVSTSTVVTVLDYNPYQILEGDKFNVIVM